jgi:hypothetical protein
LSTFYFDSDNGQDAWSLENERDTYTDQPGEDNQETLGITLRGDWLLTDALTLESVVSYIDSDLHNSYDADWVSDEFCQQYLCSFGNDGPGGLRPRPGTLGGGHAPAGQQGRRPLRDWIVCQ